MLQERPPQAGDSASKCMFSLFIIVFQNRVSVCRLKQASFELKILLLWPHLMGQALLWRSMDGLGDSILSKF